jgi:hypothetical protein
MPNGPSARYATWIAYTSVQAADKVGKDRTSSDPDHDAVTGPGRSRGDRRTHHRPACPSRSTSRARPAGASASSTAGSPARSEVERPSAAAAVGRRRAAAAATPRPRGRESGGSRYRGEVRGCSTAPAGRASPTGSGSGPPRPRPTTTSCRAGSAARCPRRHGLRRPPRADRPQRRRLKPGPRAVTVDTPPDSSKDTP